MTLRNNISEPKFVVKLQPLKSYSLCMLVIGCIKLANSAKAHDCRTSSGLIKSKMLEEGCAHEINFSAREQLPRNQFLWIQLS